MEISLINGEVDAYLFENLLGCSNTELGNSSKQGSDYGYAMDQLCLGKELKNNYQKALDNFIDGSRANANGVYNGHKIDPSYKTSMLRRIETLFKY